MTEKEMEDLLWEHPEKLLNEPLAQFQRQHPSAVGRSDLVFEDRLRRLLIIEVKKGKLPRGAIDQLHDYLGTLKRESPDRPVELMVVANVIPTERKLACEKYDIECREISEKRFREVAQEVGYRFVSEENEKPSPAVAKANLSPKEAAKPASAWVFGSGGHAPSDSNDFLERCDERGARFFSALFEHQRTVTNKCRITWNHESGFSMQFYFQGLGFVEMLWGFPLRNRKGQPSKTGQKLVFPFDFALRRNVPTSFMEEFVNDLAAGAPLVPRGKRPSIAIETLQPSEAEHVHATILKFVDKANQPRVMA